MPPSHITSSRAASQDGLKIDILCFAGDSGLGHYSISLARALEAETAAHVRVVTSDNMPAAVKGQFDNIVTPFRRTRHLPVDYCRMLASVLSRKPEIVIFQSWQKLPLLEIVMVKFFQSLGIRCLCTVHDVEPHAPKPWSHVDVPLFFKAFDGLIAHSAEARERLIQAGCKNTIVVIPHGTYDIFNLTNPSKAEARAKFPEFSPEDFVVLFFGHLDLRKGLLEFIAAARLLAGDKNIKFLIAGKAKLPPASLLELQAMEGNSQFVIHENYVPFEDVEFYFAAADLVAMPYLEGSTSGVMKLAIAFRRPILSTEIGDAAEAISNPDIAAPIGRLIPVENLAQGLADAIRSMKGNMSGYEAGLDQLNNIYSWANVGKAYGAFIESIAHKTR